MFIKNLKQRYLKEKIFKLCASLSILFALSFLLIFFSFIFYKSHKAFSINKIALEIDLSKESLIANSNFNKKYDELSSIDLIEQIGYQRLIKKSLQENFSLAGNEETKIFFAKIISVMADFSLRSQIAAYPNIIGSKAKFWLPLSSKADIYFKYKISENFSPQEIFLLNDLQKKSTIKSFFNWQFFTQTDSREPETAGVAASMIGSLWTIIIFLLCAFPIAVLCAFYLEEFAPKNLFVDFIEASINNLAAIPSIIYGLLGLTIYLQFFHLPRSSSLVGGMTLFMLVLPVIIIATRNAIRTIPQSIRDGAMALGASKMQVMLHHLLPLSMPGIMTGTILAISRALGETAPLLMIGMVIFTADIPHNFFEPATVLPVQIYLWSDSPEIGFAEKTTAAILILLMFLMLLNLFAIILRKKFERKW